MKTWHALLDEPSVENWTEIVQHGKRLWAKTQDNSPAATLYRAIGGSPPVTQTSLSNWQFFMNELVRALPRWPKEIPRECPQEWPEDFRRQVEHRVLETGTYGHYIQKICTDPRLRLSDGSQAVWLERRFVGGVVPGSIAQRAVALLYEAVSAPSVPMAFRMIREAASMLSGALRNTGKIGTADLTGGLTIETLSGKRLEIRLEIEVKVGDGKQREAQAARERSVLTRGGCYVLCNTVESAVQQVLEFKKKAEAPKGT